MGNNVPMKWQVTSAFVAGIALGYVLRGWLSTPEASTLADAKQVARDTRATANSLRFQQNRKVGV